MNRHLKIAFFMAPLLAILGYTLAGFWVEPQNDTQSERMAVLGQCQPRENACILQSGTLELKLISNQRQQQWQLAVISNQPLTHLTVALGADETFQQFPMMKSDDGKYWQIKQSADDDLLRFDQLRLAFLHKNKPRFAETGILF